MKLRTGFVSNSSSSSFVVVAPKDYDWRKNLTENEIKVYEEAFRPKSNKAFGKDVYVYTGFSDDENDLHYVENIDEMFDLEMLDDLWWKFPTLFNSNECFIHYGD